MKPIRYIAVLILGLLLAACYKDLGNYDYSEINEVSFSGFPEEKQYVFRNADTLKVYPDVSGTIDQKDLSNYTFKWVAVLKSGSIDGMTSFTLDSNTLNLVYFVRIPAAEYSVFLYVKDKNTDITWRQSFDLKVTTSLYEGWLILSDLDGYSRLDMVSLSGKDEIIVRDIWGGTPLSQWKNPRQLAHWADMNVSGGNHPVYLLAGDGAVKLNPMDYSYSEVNELKYEFGNTESGFIPSCMRGNYVDGQVICADKNAVYAKNSMTSGAVFGVAMNKVAGESQPFELAPVIGKTAYPYAYFPSTIFYDITNSRFVQMNSSATGFIKPTAPETYFPYTTGKKFVYMGTTIHDTYGYVFTILKDNAEKCWLYGLRSINYGASLEQGEKYYYQIDAPDIEKASCFAIHPVFYYLFYAVGNQIHQYDMVAKSHRILPITFKEGEKNALPENEISMLKFNVFALGAYSKPAGSTEMQYRLIVGSGNGGKELDGVVRMLEISSVMDQPASIYREYNNLGKVVDVVYRERN